MGLPGAKGVKRSPTKAAGRAAVLGKAPTALARPKAFVPPSADFWGDKPFPQATLEANLGIPRDMPDPKPFNCV